MSESMNAAQLASRKIKSAKGVKGKLGNRSIPSAGGYGVNGTSSFTGQDASSGGGLFGGGLNAAGTFNFSAPVQGISFGNNSGNSTPFWGSDTEEDRRANAIAEEVERRNKPFRMVDGSAAATSQPFSSTFQRTPLSALGQPNGLGAVSDAAKNNSFQISRSQSPAVASTFNFGSTSAQEQQPASNIFSFGQNPQAASASNSFRLGNPPVQEKPTSNIFSFNQQSAQAQPVSTDVSFSSTTATEKPTSSIFSFSQTSSHPLQPSSSTINFNPTPAPVNIFANSNASNSTPTTNLFGPSNQQSTSFSNIFQKLNPQTATTNGIFDDKNQQPTTPAKSLFGESAQKPAPTSSLFGGSHQQIAPTSNIFGNLIQASASSGNLFGTPKPQSPPSSNLFGVHKDQSGPTSNLFGAQKEQPATLSKLSDSPEKQSTPTSNLFGGQNELPTPTSNIFGGQQQQPTPAVTLLGRTKPSSNLFGSQQSGTNSNSFANKPSTTTSNIFGNQTQNSNVPTNFFANFNKPTAQVSEPTNSTTDNALQNANGEGNASVVAGLLSSVGSSLQNGDNASRPPPFPKSAPVSLQSTSLTFGSANEPEAESVLPSIEIEGPLMDDDLLSKLENGTPTQPSMSNLFSSIKPAEGLEGASQSAPSGIFPSLSQSTSTALTTTNAFTNANVARSSSSPSKFSSSRATVSVNGTSTTKDNELAKLQNYYSEMGEVPDSAIEGKCPQYFTDAQKIQFFAAYRLRSLNKGIKLYIDGAKMGADFGPAFSHYISRREEILEACATGLNNLKRKHDVIHDEVEKPQSSPNKRLKPSENVAAYQHLPRKSSPLKTQPVVNSQPDQPASPEKQPRPEAPKMFMSPTKKAQPSINGSTTPKAPPPSKSLFSQQPAVPPSPSPRGKRKAEVQIDKDHPTEEKAIGASHSSKWHSPNGNKAGSATSSVFKSILDSPSQPALGSPEKKMFSLSKTQPTDKPRFNPFASLPMPPESPLSTSPKAKLSAPSSASTTSLLQPKSGAHASSLFPANPADSNRIGASSRNSVSGQIPSNLSAPEESPHSSSFFVPKTASTSGNKSQASPSNKFAPKVSNMSNLVSTNPTTNSTNMFAAKPSSTLTAPNLFAPKPASAVATSTSSSDAETKTVKPPTFGGAPVNFLAQFGQKSKKSMADAEVEAMEKAKIEDMDSDEDETEWEAKYKEKRAAEKKATEELTKSKRAMFVPGKGFTFDKAQAAPEAEKSAAKSILSQTSAPFSAGSNLFAPINRSEASSPGAASSRASSVFDGHGPPQPASFGGHNIFGHLSDVDSGPDSGKGNDADDDATDGESADFNGDQDDEKKDTTYDPSAEDAAGPGTPVEETGPGIASAKKPTTILNFGGSSNSGASTPSTSGGSLFDRISKDPNGNPIRQIPAENKENAGPGAASIFGSDGGNPFAKFGQKSSVDQNKAGRDNTWTQDSPIRFGASTTSPPTVNVTAPTPAKPTPFAGLFGGNAPPTPTGSPFSGVFGNNTSATSSSPAPFASLFGNNGTPKPASGLFAHLSENKPAAVGFGFGSMAGSSLLPSTAGSTATSRATSPGGTTDAESNNENVDPEVEHHEQIDLISGGPGEENEEVLHQVRTKALKFELSKDVSGKSNWAVKGLGPLRVLKNKETGSSRVLLRADPSGTIVLNKGILGNVTHTAAGKTLKLLTAGEGGQGLETWLLQVKTPAGAEELAGVLEANKRKD